MKKGNLVIKISYFVISMITIWAAYTYTDDLMTWLFNMLMQYAFESIRLL